VRGRSSRRAVSRPSLHGTVWTARGLLCCCAAVPRAASKRTPSTQDVSHGVTALRRTDRVHRQGGGRGAHKRLVLSKQVDACSERTASLGTARHAPRQRQNVCSSAQLQDARTCRWRFTRTGSQPGQADRPRNLQQYQGGLRGGAAPETATGWHAAEACPQPATFHPDARVSAR